MQNHKIQDKKTIIPLELNKNHFCSVKNKHPQQDFPFGKKGVKYSCNITKIQDKMTIIPLELNNNNKKITSGKHPQ